MGRDTVARKAVEAPEDDDDYLSLEPVENRQFDPHAVHRVAVVAGWQPWPTMHRG
jgi:hypothetical protein